MSPVRSSSPDADKAGGLLDGMRILDFTHLVAGPMCTKLLADYGADVIKIERPGSGDPARLMPPFAGDVPHPERSGLFLHLNTNKRSLTLNLKDPTGQRIVQELVSQADAVVESFAPGTLERMGLGFDALRAVNPRIVVTSISNFGQTGPYRDWRASEIVEYAMGGAMYATGDPDREPIMLGGSVIQTQAGEAAALATVTALFGTHPASEANHLDISIMETQAASQDRRATMLISYQFTGRVNDRKRRAGSVGGGVKPTADGYFNLTAQSHWFAQVVKMMGHPELADDPRFNSDAARLRPEAQDEIEPYVLPWYLSRTMREAWQEAQRNKLLSGPIYTPKDIVEDPYFKERGYWERIRHPIAGDFEYPGPPFRVHGAPRAPRRPAPTLGQHTREILCGELGMSALQLGQLRALGVIS